MTYKGLRTAVLITLGIVIACLVVYGNPVFYRRCSLTGKLCIKPMAMCNCNQQTAILSNLESD